MEVLIGFAINIDPYEDYETNHFLISIETFGRFAVWQRGQFV